MVMEEGYVSTWDETQVLELDKLFLEKTTFSNVL